MLISVSRIKEFSASFEELSRVFFFFFFPDFAAAELDFPSFSLGFCEFGLMLVCISKI